MDLYDPYLVPYSILSGYYNFPRGTNKIQFFDIIATSGKKIVNLMKDLKYEHQSTFPLWRRSNIILGTGTENQILILRTSAAIKFFQQILKNCHFGVKKNHYPPR